jgi:NNP family nitrate/nitrite transporter-like MFS transporter
MHAFMPAAVGGRTLNIMNNVIGCGAMTITTLLLQNTDASYAGLFCMAVASGIGGGGFSSIISGISEFFPERLQGTALGIVGGVGNLGISLSQLLYFLLGDYGICFSDKRGFCVPTDLGGKWSYQVTVIWIFLLFLGIMISYFFMHNIPEHGVQKDMGGRRVRYRNTWNIMRYLGMQAIVYLVAFCGAGIFWAFAPLVRDVPELAIFRGFIIAAVSAAAITILLFLTTLPTHMGECVQEMFKILRSLDTFLLSLLYIMSFSSFLGYANTFPKLIKAMFPHVQSVRDYSWMAPLLGSLARVLGGVVADKVTGAYSTGVVAAVMTASTFVMGFIIRMAMASGDPAGQFPGFVLLHAILFIATGFGNGSVFRLIAVYLPRGTAGPTLGWTGAMAAYGGAIFPTFFDAGINAGVNDMMYYMISGYYGLCMIITWRYCFWVSKLA